MKRTLITLTLALAIATPMFAAQQTAPLAISASVANTCTITTTPVAFGAYDTVVGTAVAGTGTVNVTCTKGATSLTIDLNTGGNSGSATLGMTRAMINGANFLSYDLYTNVGHTIVWSAGVTIPDAPSKASRPYTVYGQIAAGQDVPAGAYTDSVTAAINY